MTEDRDTGVPDLIDRAALREAVKRLDFPSAHAFGTEGLNALSRALALIDAAPAAEPVPLTLDAAWKEAEAVLPKGWSLLIGDERKYGKSGWWATGSEPYDEAKHGFKIVSSSDKAVLYATPAEALQALAALLGAIPVDTQEGT